MKGTSWFGHSASGSLSSLRVALNAAEPVRAKTIRDFESTFRLKNIMSAGYGLAEATVGVSMMPPGSSLRIDVHGLVSAGYPFPGVEISILVNGQAAAPGEIGEIAIASPANSPGYYCDPEGTSAITWEDRFILSGDLGYLDPDGYLTIVSRKKNIIKHSGETIAPSEIEELVEAVVGSRRAAAVGIDRGRFEGEQVYIFAEVRGTLSPDSCETFVLAIVNNFQSQLGFRPGRVYILKTNALPYTYNGKFQHALLKERYLSGELRASGQILYPGY